MVVDTIKTYYYICTPHISMGMKAVIISNYTDCNGVINGSSLMDTFGVCQQSYIYDYITHAVTMLNDTMNVTLGPTEMLVLADDSSNTYWNDCDSTTTNIVIIKDSKSRTIVRIVDILGRDTEPKNNVLLLYIYDDGTIEKKVTLE